ncbi:LCP family protein [Ferviditalea candida]|uniref:LCP family protein n=1 Tax=Ferviditalea candida TaxID=3108399 RepID=A0ABU5ZQN0_9BACL|nr:LCP family protein [Paenibacillaceae bacterium T2]
MLALLGVSGYYAYSIWHFADDIKSKPETSRFKKFQNQGEVYQPPKWEGTERVNILLMGGDSRGLRKNEIPRSDTIMIASLDPVGKTAYLFSILRDTYTEIPGHDHERINAAITLGGPDLAMKTVTQLTGIPIQYYVYTDFKGFIELIDAIGGIDYYVEKDMKYSDAADDHVYDINLKKGMQHLDGNTALQYVRFRHDAMSDFARTERQRKFLQAIGYKLQTTYSLIKLPQILDRVKPYIETNLTIMDMLKLSALGFEIRSDAVEGIQLPPTQLLRDEKIGGAAVIGVNERELQKFVEKLFSRKPENGNEPPAKSQSNQSQSNPQ